MTDSSAITEPAPSLTELIRKKLFDADARLKLADVAKGLSRPKKTKVAVRGLQPEIEIATIVEEGQSGALDPEVLALAHCSGRLLLSHDVNTLRAEADRRIVDGRGVAGVFLAVQRTAIRAVAETIVMIWSSSEAEEWIDRVEFIPF